MQGIECAERDPRRHIRGRVANRGREFPGLAAGPQLVHRTLSIRQALLGHRSIGPEPEKCAGGLHVREARGKERSRAADSALQLGGRSGLQQRPQRGRGIDVEDVGHGSALAVGPKFIEQFRGGAFRQAQPRRAPSPISLWQRRAGEFPRLSQPAQQIVQIVQEELTTLLGTERRNLDSQGHRPAPILLVGLQGSGKTTTAAKLALHLRKQGHRSLLIAADTRRPAAMDQLEALGKQLDVPVYREEAGPDDAPRVAANGLKRAREMGVAWAIVDTGGRLHVDDALMEELVVMKAALDPAEVLLVVDAMTGQDAVNAATAFNERIGLTGLVLSKLDGDSRGGAALSATQVTGVPVKFAGISEQLDGLEVFHPERMASRILGMGDIVTLVERVQEQTTEEEAAEMERKLRRAQFDLDDFLKQLRALQKMGPLSSLLEMLPGAGKMRAQLPPGGVDERRVRRIEAIISSMTMWERQHPERINGSRRRRVAQGSGTTPSDINQLLAQFREMQKMLKQLASGRPNALGALAGAGAAGRPATRAERRRAKRGR